MSGNNRPATEAELDLIEAAQDWDDAQEGAQYGPMHQELVRAERGLRDAIANLRAENDGRWRRP